MNAIQLKRNATKATLMIALTLLMTSCLFDKLKKNKDPEPELAGTYQVSRLVDESQNLDTSLPITVNGQRLSAIVIVTRSGDTEINFQIDLSNNGQLIARESATATIQKASGKDYNILDGNTRVGLINGTDFNLDYTEGGDRFAIIANK